MTVHSLVCNKLRGKYVLVHCDFLVKYIALSFGLYFVAEEPALSTFRVKIQAVVSSETLMTTYMETNYYKSEEGSLNFTNPVP